MLMLERIIVESIAKGERKLEGIQLDTSLDYSILLSVLSRLVKKGLVSYKSGEYNIFKNDIAWKKENNDQRIESEIKEITESLVSSYFEDKENNSLKLQKVYVSKKNEKILKSLFNNIEMFFNDLRKEQRKEKNKKRTGEQKVVLWGYSNYKDLIENSMAQVS